MTFTLVAVLKDKMTDMVQQRVKKKVEEEKEKERREIEVFSSLHSLDLGLSRIFPTGRRGEDTRYTRDSR